MTANTTTVLPNARAREVLADVLGYRPGSAQRVSFIDGNMIPIVFPSDAIAAMLAFAKEATLAPGDVEGLPLAEVLADADRLAEAVDMGRLADASSIVDTLRRLAKHARRAATKPASDAAVPAGEDRPITEHPCYGLFSTDGLSHRAWLDKDKNGVCERCGTQVHGSNKEQIEGTPLCWEPPKPEGKPIEQRAEELFKLIYAHTVIKYDPAAGIRCCAAALLGAAPVSLATFGAGLREVAAVDSAAFTSHSIGCAVYQQDRARGGPPCICGLVDEARSAALATDATDGATDGGYPKGATIAVDACGPVNATTPGADLLEQAAIVEEWEREKRDWHGNTSLIDRTIRALSARNLNDKTKDTDDGE